MSKLIRYEGHLYSPELQIMAETVEDFEKFRKAAVSRLYIFTKDSVDKDGEIRGKGFDKRSAQASDLQKAIDEIEATERDLISSLKRALRKHPIGKWQKDPANKGLGEKTIARLLGTSHDPYWHTLENRPRTVSELWAYCGMHVIDGEAARRRKGQTTNWNTNAGPRLHNIVEPIIQGLKRTCGRVSDDDEFATHTIDCECYPHRIMYDQYREKNSDAIHSVECRRCGPKGKPAAVGSPLSLGHKHARAMRIVKKEVLRSLWEFSRDWYNIQGYTEENNWGF